MYCCVSNKRASTRPSSLGASGDLLNINCGSYIDTLTPVGKHSNTSASQKTLIPPGRLLVMQGSITQNKVRGLILIGFVNGGCPLHGSPDIRPVNQKSAKPWISHLKAAAAVCSLWKTEIFPPREAHSLIFSPPYKQLNSISIGLRLFSQSCKFLHWL